MTSISTTNSGRAKPETITSVEAGYGAEKERIAHAHIVGEVLAPRHIGIDADDVFEAKPGFTQNGRDIVEAEFRLPRAIGGMVLSTDMPSWPEQKTRRWPGGTTMPWL